MCTFIHTCIHCLSTSGGEKTAHPFGQFVHGTKPNDLLQFDYLEIGSSSENEKYVLMMRDDHSGYVWLFPSTYISAEHAAQSIIDWSAAFGVPGSLMSYDPTHFKNQTLHLVAKGLKVPYHFSLP